MIRYKILIVGGFRGAEFGVYGGVVRSCELLMRSNFTQVFDVTVVDSTQRANPVPNVVKRIVYATVRMFVFFWRCLSDRPDGLLLFYSHGLSFFEKTLMGWIGRLLGSQVFLFPRAGVLMENSRQHWFNRNAVKILSQCGHVFLCQGKKWQRFAINDLGFAAQKTHIVPNWTAEELFLDIGRSRSFGAWDGNVVRVMFMGWLEPEKGVRELLGSVQLVRSKGVAISLSILGCGSLDVEVRDFVVRHGLSDVVKLYGWVQNKKVIASIMKEHDIFVLPSWSEGLPNAVIEAMGTGLCAIITDVGVISDFFTDEKEALVIKPKSETELAKALEKLSKNKKLRQKIGHSGYNLVSNKFAVEPAINHLIEVISEEIANARKR
ncbi:glycosyltransferase family 4 protein [Alphaproteobacteria bacterium]|nr:glycosyltransferase family 4 protein [Alphaproteobacteria bacterium]